MPPHLNIAVVGAGIVGVSVAALLGKKGFSVTVFEAKSGLDEIGAGITSHPSAARIISTVIEPGAFEKVATQPERVVFRRYADSKILGSKKQPTTEGAACTGLLHRADLQKILYDAARQHGASVRFGSRIVNIDDTGAKPVLSIKDGPRAEYDLVIAADGVQSEIRGAVIPYSSSCVKMTDECVFRSVINVDKIKMFPEFGQYLTKEDQTIVLGPSKHLVLYPPIRNGSLLNLVWSSYLHKVASIEGWNKQTSYKEPQEDFSGFDPHVLRLLEHADDVSKWRVAEVRDLPTWRSKSGRVVLMGDAAHAMIPHAAQVCMGSGSLGRSQLMIGFPRAPRKALRTGQSLPRYFRGSIMPVR